MTPSYPPEPWRLAGDAYASVWPVPRAKLPRLPGGLRPLTMGGRALVITAWVDYQDCGQLAYHELLATVAVRRGAQIAGTITDIWVDSPASMAGGRELWGIPKDLATLDFTGTGGHRHFTASASTADDWIATASFAARPGSAGKLPSRFRVIQSMGGTLLGTPVRASTAPRPATAAWNVNPDGPLGYLAAHRPLLSVALRDFALRFGTENR